jgi:hypothetical protein
MTGRSERPSRPPRENRKASQGQTTDRAPSTYRQERSALVMLYAAKIAAARLYARKEDIDAIVAALRAEEKAALRALKERREFAVQAKRRNKFAWNIAKALVARRKSSSINPRRPRRWRSQRRTSLLLRR